MNIPEEIIDQHAFDIHEAYIKETITPLLADVVQTIYKHYNNEFITSLGDRITIIGSTLVYINNKYIPIEDDTHK